MNEPSPPVLIVEDNTETSAVLSWILDLRGYESVTRTDGLDALTYLRSGGTASVIVLDLWMPNMDGWSFLHALTADPRWTSIPVIIFSAYAEGEDDRLPAVIGVVRKGGVDPDVLLGLIAEGQRRFNDSGAAT